MGLGYELGERAEERAMRIIAPRAKFPRVFLEANSFATRLYMVGQLL